MTFTTAEEVILVLPMATAKASAKLHPQAMAVAQALLGILARANPLELLAAVAIVPLPILTEIIVFAIVHPFLALAGAATVLTQVDMSRLEDIGGRGLLDPLASLPLVSTSPRSTAQRPET